MMTLIEEMRLAVLQLWESMGFERSSRTAAAVVPALVLGVALNVAALSVVNHVRASCHRSGERVTLTGIVRAEVKAVRTVAVSTQKKINAGQRKLCSARQWMLERQANAVHLYSEMRCISQAGVSSNGAALCIRTGHWKMPGRRLRGIARLA